MPRGGGCQGPVEGYLGLAPEVHCRLAMVKTKLCKYHFHVPEGTGRGVNGALVSVAHLF